MLGYLKTKHLLALAFIAIGMTSMLQAVPASAHYIQPGSYSVSRFAVEAGLARDCNEAGKLNKENCGIVRYLVMFINILSALVGIIVVIMIAIGGIQYSASKDNPQATEAAKGRILNAVIALVAYLFLFAFLQWIVPGGIF